jgi:acetyl esterase
VHPELAGILDRLPARPADPYADIEATRAGFKAMMAPLMHDDSQVSVEHADGVPVQVLRPAGLPGTLPCVIYIHGGGFAYGELDGPSPMARQVCAEVGAVVVNVHYRLAPEHLFPAGDRGLLHRAALDRGPRR